MIYFVPVQILNLYFEPPSILDPEFLLLKAIQMLVVELMKGQSSHQGQATAPRSGESFHESLRLNTQTIGATNGIYIAARLCKPQTQQILEGRFQALHQFCILKFDHIERACNLNKISKVIVQSRFLDDTFHSYLYYHVARYTCVAYSLENYLQMT